MIVTQMLSLCSAKWYDDVVNSTRLPYSKTASECYRPALRTHRVLITTLINLTHDRKNRVFESLPNLLANTPGDVGFFHTGWSEDEIADLQARHPYITFVTCVASSDWLAPAFQPGEAIETRSFGAGYRSMCRWYSSQVSWPAVTI